MPGPFDLRGGSFFCEVERCFNAERFLHQQNGIAVSFIGDAEGSDSQPVTVKFRGELCLDLAGVRDKNGVSYSIPAAVKPLYGFWRKESVEAFSVGGPGAEGRLLPGADKEIRGKNADDPRRSVRLLQ